MDTPIVDFVRRYAASGVARLHMPGHKGRPLLGCEPWDITEIAGADALWEAEGIIRRSEENAAALFGSRATFYSIEGSSQCIRAMVLLAVTERTPGREPLILAARNVHKAFVYAAALAGARVEWIWPEKSASLCSCPVSPAALEEALSRLPGTPAAVYVTSPDYLGARADIAALAAVCRRWETPLLVDNAHGAYLHFCQPPQSPLDLGAALSCDSAHKTLPALTGAAYLHVGKAAPVHWEERARGAMAAFGSTSPSYLTLASLDACNRYLAEGYPERLRETAARLEEIRARLRDAGWEVLESDALRLTLRGDGPEMARRLRAGGVEMEYSDRDHLVLMATPENAPEDLERAVRALGRNDLPPHAPPDLPIARGEAVLTPREALFAPRERVPIEQALGRICGAPTVSCPPAVPVVVSGERIGPEAVALMRYLGLGEADVLR